MQGLKSLSAYSPAISDRSKDKKNNVDLKKKMRKMATLLKKMKCFAR